MGKIIKTQDAKYRVRFENKTYYLEKRYGRWYNKKWAILFMTINKTLFIKQINKYLV
jgi:hypothetical protein